MSVCGIVLAAGAGSRYGCPKALARESDGTPWIELAVRALRSAGCAPILVVLGAEHERAAALVPPECLVTVAPHWQEGLSNTLRHALAEAEQTRAAAALITPVDTPGLPAEACRRVMLGAGRSALARAVYRGMPGHPVLVGRGHWSALRAAAHGDAGAGPYLRTLGARETECGDLWNGEDIDHRDSRPAG